MGAYNFADSYRMAGLAPGADIIRARQKPFETLRGKLTTSQTVDLTRLYFGLATSSAPPWFRDAFAAADASFSMIDNARECAVLASCLLAAGLEDGLVAAGLAPLAAAAGGFRTPLVQPDLLDHIRAELRSEAVKRRQSSPVEINRLTGLAKPKVTELADQLAANPDWAKAVALFKHVDESLGANRTLASHVVGALKPLSRRLAHLEEEVGILWWYVGGWSRVLERPFGEMPLALAATLAGLELAALTTTSPGPIAADAILSRLVTAGRPESSNTVSIVAAVDAFPSEAYDQLALPAALSDLPDLCPMHTAFRMAHEIGETPAWHSPFRRTSQLSGDPVLGPLALSVQVYREALLLSLLA